MSRRRRRPLDIEDDPLASTSASFRDRFVVVPNSLAPSPSLSLIATTIQASGVAHVDEVVDLDARTDRRTEAKDDAHAFEALVLLRPRQEPGSDPNVQVLQRFHAFFSSPSTLRTHPCVPRVRQSHLGRAPFGVVVAVRTATPLVEFGDAEASSAKIPVEILAALGFQLSQAALQRARMPQAWTRSLPPLTPSTLGVSFDGYAQVACTPPAEGSAVSMFQLVRELSTLLRPVEEQCAVPRPPLAATHIFELAAYAAELWDECGALTPADVAAFAASFAPRALALELDHAEERALWRDSLAASPGHRHREA